MTGPGLAHRGVRGDHHRQRQQQNEKGAAGVEENLADQPDFEPG